MADDSGSSFDEPADQVAPQEAPVEQPQQPAADPSAQSPGSKVLQQLTGKIGQEVRVNTGITSDEIKGTVNSILAAAKGRLDAEAVADIEKKLADATAAPVEPTEPAEQEPIQGEEQPMAEVIGDDENDAPSLSPQPNDLLQQYPMLKSGFVTDIIRRAGLSHMLNSSDDASGVVFDLCEAMYVYGIEQNSNTPFIHNLNKMLRDWSFKASPMINSSDDLSEEGVMLYNALLQKEEAQASPRPQNKSSLPSQAGGFSLNEAQKKIILSKIIHGG